MVVSIVHAVILGVFLIFCCYLASFIFISTLLFFYFSRINIENYCTDGGNDTGDDFWGEFKILCKFLLIKI